MIQSCRSLIALGALLLIPATLRSENLPKPLLKEMTAINERISQGFLNKDLDAIMSCYAKTPDVQAVIYGEYFRGPEAIRQATAAGLAFPGTIRNEVVSVNYTRVGELIIVVGVERNTLTPADGSPAFTMDAVWSDVRKKIHGKWVMVLNHVTLLP